MKTIPFYIIFVLLFSLNCFSQFSKTHYIPPLSGASSVTSEEQFLYISTPNVNPVNFRIIELGGNTIIGTVSRNVPFVYNVGFGNDTQLHVDESLASGVLNNKGYIVEADDLVYVSARVTAGNGNQAGQVVSKGLAALGLRFRVGAFTNTLVNNYVDIHYTFVSVLATENNTTVTFSGMKTGVQLVNSATGDSPFSILLNRGESYVMAVQGPTNENRDGLIGSLVLADKPIAVNCGSFGGSNAVANLDLGFDQIVPVERITSSDYIFIKSTGIDEVEKVILVADEDNTEIFLNGSTIPSYTLNSGEYGSLQGSDFSANGNLYVTSSKKVFAYQSIGDDGAIDQRNQELFFVPPLSCQTPRVIDNIPFIDLIGTRQFTGRVTIVTTTGATLNFIIDGTNYTLASLAGIGVNVVGPIAVIGNTNYETYVLTGVTGNVSVYSTGELYLAAYGSEQAATFGGYYSGFTFKPEISFNVVDIAQLGCIPNSILSVNSLSPFDVFQWYFNGSLIPGASNNTYQPLNAPAGFGPGYYYVSATIAGCTSPKDSDNIPVSSCPNDSDNDDVNDNVDLDNDNDGIPNCAESYGNQVFNLFNTASGSISINTYNNSYTGAITFEGTGTPSVTPVFGDAGGNFVTEAAQGKSNSVSYTLSNFTSPISLSVSYADIAAANDLFTSSTEIRITCPVNKTLTILNPTNQLLIDTNYDGIFESGITQYSSFEIRFRLNSSIALPAGTGTFSINGNLINSIVITNINLSETTTSRVALNLFATCIPKDSDGDGIADQNDLDSDNDSILDLFEAQGPTFLALSNVDLNQDGIDDVFGAGIYPPDVPNADVDGDEVPNYLDLDSDNDGIHDIDETGFTITDADNNGIIDGANFGANGLFNPIETATDSGIINSIYVLADTDADGIYNAIELDSDNDLCNDVIEAGYLDSNLDGLLGGTTPPTVNPINGLVTSGIGYGNPNPNYITAAPIIINTQPQNSVACELQSVTFTISTNAINTYQWQLSIDSGVTWSIISDNATYSGAGTNALTVSNVTPSMVGYQYRCFLNKNGNACGLNSSAAILTTYPLPVVTTPISLKQCDDDTDGISIFNLTQKNDVISTNYLNETFTYYTTLAAANTQNNTFLIANPIAYTSVSGSVFARVQNSNGCFRVARIDLLVSVTQIPSSYVVPNQYLCDDYLDVINNDRDGISGPYNFTSITNNLLGFLPGPTANYSIKYYKTEADFLAETDALGNSLEITNTTTYRNIGFPNTQTIWVRVESTLDNSCYGFKTFDVVVETLPTANLINAINLIRQCDDDQDGIYGFDTSTIQATVLNGQTGVNVKYFRANGTQLSTPLPNPFFVTGTETITIRVSNNSTQTGGQPCYDEETLDFIVDDLPETFAISSNLIAICDEEINPVDQNGLYDFDTSTFQSTLLGGQTGVNVYYFDQNNNPLPSPLVNPFTTGTQNVRVVVENPINIACKAQLNIPFFVHPTPKIDLEENIIICLPTTQALIDSGILDGTPASDYSFQWYTNNVLMSGITTPSLTVNTPGTYSVDVTNAFGCTKTRVITVTGSEIATIQSIEIVDLADVNSITVNVTGLGDYEFALDDINGPYRDSNFFENVPMGLHDIYVRDKNGCGSLGPITVAVLGIPQYFTPNGDGYNDYWNVKGVSPQFNYLSTIYIFDRFGKLLRQIGTTGLGWDGTFNGLPMPADDYWYNIKFEDGRSAKGHFTLKR